MTKPRTIDPKRNRWMFSLGTSGRDMFYAMYTSYLFSFIIYTKNLTTPQFTVVSIVMVACRAFDAIIDPLIGGLVENTRSRWGRFKPWIVIGMVFAALALILIFSLPLDGWEFIVMLAAANIFLTATYSLNDIAYWGMMPALTSIPSERSKLTSLSTFCGSVGSALAFLLVPLLTNGKHAIGGSAVIAYPIIAVIACAAMWGTQFLTLFGVHEPKASELAAERAPKLSLRDIFKVVLKNDQLLWASLSIFMQTFASGLFTSALSMFYVYLRFGYDGKLIPLSSVGYAIGGVLANVFLAKLHAKYGRKRCVLGAMLSFAAGSAFILTTGLLIPVSSPYVLFACYAFGQIFMGLGGNGFYMTMLVSISNSVEYNEYRTGKRQEGLIYSVRPFVSQMSGACAQAAVTGIFLTLGLLGISNGISELENQAAKQTITENVKLGQIKDLLEAVGMDEIRWLLIAITVIPAAFVVAGYCIYRKKYFIDEEYYDKIRAETTAKGEE
ncbi:MAG: MFS transporter [Oscillospiraceae bacterium]|jgi:melibiose permease/lactose/raffinose/galactose permease|nr:MFS transporter [Oscillospiraceae bacterium]